MSDLQSAIAGLSTIDIEGDPIDALDACLVVFRALNSQKNTPQKEGSNAPAYEFMGFQPIDILLDLKDEDSYS
jgi:hypothetical protein